MNDKWQQLRAWVLPVLLAALAFGCARSKPVQVVLEEKGAVIDEAGFIRIPNDGNCSVDIRQSSFVCQYKGHRLLGLLHGRTVQIDGNLFVLAKPSYTDGKTIFVHSAVLNYLRNMETLAQRPKPSKSYLVILDPGHGGKDPGANYGGIKEKDVVLTVARYIAEELKKRRIKVILTRKSDYYITLKDRVNISNKNCPDLFVSIHANASRSRNAKGVEVYYVSEKADDTTRALVAAENAVLKIDEQVIGANKEIKAIVWDLLNTEHRAESKAIADHLSRKIAETLGTVNRGAKGGPFYVLKWTNAPAVLIETGFVSNKDEARKLASPAWQKRIAGAIAEGIIDYLWQQE